MSLIEAEQLANELWQIILPFEQHPSIKRLKVRLRELGDDTLDEQAQFFQLQKACRENTELEAALTQANLGPVANLNVRQPSPFTGKLVQAFNAMVEHHWRRDL